MTQKMEQQLQKNTANITRRQCHPGGKRADFSEVPGLPVPQRGSGAREGRLATSEAPKGKTKSRASPKAKPRDGQCGRSPTAAPSRPCHQVTGHAYPLWPLGTL